MSKFLLLLLSSLFSVAAVSQNLVTNGGFESVIGNEWDILTNMPVSERAAIAKRSGDFGYHFRFDAGSQKGNLRVNGVTHPITWEDGKTYEISFWYKSIVPSTDASANMKAYLEPGTFEFDDRVFITTPNTEWTRIGWQYVPSASAAGDILISVRPNADGSGEIYIDDISVREIDTPGSPYFDSLANERVQSSDEVTWKPFGPGTSGYCEEFWIHPTDPDVMIMGPDMNNTLGTWDGATSWQTIKDHDGNGYDLRRTHDIKFSLTDPDFGVAIEREGDLFTTNDRGRNWTKVRDLGNAHRIIAIHPTDDDIWLIGAGDFWNVKDNHRSQARPEGILQGRADYGYIWKTTDRGATFRKVATDIDPNLDVGRLIFNPNNPDSVIMAAGQGIFVSGDGGESWTPSAMGLPNNLPRDLTSHHDAATGSFTLFAVEQTVFTPNGTSITSTGGVYKSTDGGLNWESITGNLGIDLTRVDAFWPRRRYYDAVRYWLGISRQQAENNFPIYPTRAIPVFNRLVVNPLNPDEIYLSHNKKHDFSFGPGDVWKTSDGGQTWTASARNGKYWINQDNASYWQGRGNPTGANVTFAHLQDYMDGQFEGSGTRMLAINSRGEVFAGIDQQLLKSADGGVSWRQIDDLEHPDGSGYWIGKGGNNLPGRFMLLETGIPDRKLFCSGEHGLWESAPPNEWTDEDVVPVQQIEGQTKDVNGNKSAHSISTVAVHPQNPDIIYFLSWRQEHRGKLRRSMDGGETWENIATIFESNTSPFGSEGVATQNSLIIDPVNPDNMYFCATYRVISEVQGGTGPDLTRGEYGVYRSNDGGFTWNVSNTDFPANASVRRIAMHPDDPKKIYAALNQFGNNDPYGLFMSTDGAVSFTRVILPTQIRSVNNVFIDRNTKEIFISCGARNGEPNAGGVWRSKDDGETWSNIFYAPYVWQCETSPANPNVIVVTVPAQVPDRLGNFLNPGMYLSRDGGQTWIKINKNIGQPDRMVDVKPDPEDENVLWAAAWGTAWYRGVIDAEPVSTEVASSGAVPVASVSPNPFANDLTVHLNGKRGIAKVEIRSISGRLIQRRAVSPTDQRIDLSFDDGKLRPGVYLVQLSGPNSLEVLKVVHR